MSEKRSVIDQLPSGPMMENRVGDDPAVEAVGMAGIDKIERVYR